MHFSKLDNLTSKHLFLNVQNPPILETSSLEEAIGTFAEGHEGV